MRTACLLLLVGLAACDSATPAPGSPPSGPTPSSPPPATPPTGTGAPTFVTSGAPASVALEVAQSRELPMHAFFGAQPPPGFTVVGTGEGPAIRAIQQGTVLLIIALAPGEARVTITAAAPGYQDLVLMIPVTVATGMCPPPVEAGASDLFPAAPGDVWRFAYHSTDSASGVSADGTLTMTFGTPTCLGGVRTWTVRHAVDARTSGPGVSGYLVKTVTSTMTENGANEVRVVLPPYESDGAVALVGRYSADSPADVPSAAGCAASAPGSGAMRFQSGAGLVRESLTCGSGFAVRFRSLTRLAARPRR